MIQGSQEFHDLVECPTSRARTSITIAIVQAPIIARVRDLYITVRVPKCAGDYEEDAMAAPAVTVCPVDAKGYPLRRQTDDGLVRRVTRAHNLSADDWSVWTLMLRVPRVACQAIISAPVRSLLLARAELEVSDADARYVRADVRVLSEYTPNPPPHQNRTTPS